LRDPFAARRYAGYSAVWQLFACLSVCLSACSPVWLYCVVSVKLPKRKESSIFYCNICAHHATTEWGGGSGGQRPESYMAAAAAAEAATIKPRFPK